MGAQEKNTANKITKVNKVNTTNTVTADNSVWVVEQFKGMYDSCVGMHIPLTLINRDYERGNISKKIISVNNCEIFSVAVDCLFSLYSQYSLCNIYIQSIHCIQS